MAVAVLAEFAGAGYGARRGARWKQCAVAVLDHLLSGRDGAEEWWRELGSLRQYKPKRADRGMTVLSG